MDSCIEKRRNLFLCLLIRNMLTIFAGFASPLSSNCWNNTSATLWYISSVKSFGAIYFLSYDIIRYSLWAMSKEVSGIASSHLLFWFLWRRRFSHWYRFLTGLVVFGCLPSAFRIYRQAAVNPALAAYIFPRLPECKYHARFFLWRSIVFFATSW